MKKYLLPKKGKFYKANLHCHSTVSDGSLTPAEIKDAYLSRGYSVVAFTDHDVLLSHSDLNDDTFLALNGYEIEIKTKRNEKTCHICLIGLKPDNLTQVCYHREKYMIGNGDLYRDFIDYDKNLPDYERVYTYECINDIIKTARDNGFFATYNHPGWSLEGPDEYMNYNGMHAMEIYNHGCSVEGYPDYNEKEYEHMLRGGKRIYCIATDDNHNRFPFESRKSDSFGGFTMIKAEKLTYKTVTEALINGNFYASQGPEIYELWTNNGKLHVECSNADQIILNTRNRTAKIAFAQDKEPLNEATFDIPNNCGWVRITIIDKYGKLANTNAYFIDE